MNLTERIRIHFWRVNKVRKIHGLKAVFGLYLAKIPLLSLLLRKIFGRILIKTRILNSIMYLNVFDEGLHRKLLLNGIREPNHVNQIKNNVKEEMVGVEIGANVGYFGLFGARLVGDRGKIYCIEPEPKNLELLKKNIKANRFKDRMKVFQYLVGDHNGREKLSISEFGNVHSVSKDNLRATGRFVEVPMTTLDSFLENNGLKPEDVDFIRMDIEGYEVMAFQGMKRLLEARSPLKIFMETHPAFYPEWGWTYEKLLRYLDSYGFRIREMAKEKDIKNEIFEPIILRNPTVEQILESEKAVKRDGGQGFWERV